MSTLEVHPSTVESIYFPVRSDHPTTGPQALNALTVEIACPTDGVAPSSWITASWSSGTRKYGEHRYYVAAVSTSSLSLSNDTTYQPWIRIGGASGAIIKCPSKIKATNT